MWLHSIFYPRRTELSAELWVTSGAAQHSEQCWDALRFHCSFYRECCYLPCSYLAPVITLCGVSITLFSRWGNQAHRQWTRQDLYLSFGLWTCSLCIHLLCAYWPVTVCHCYRCKQDRNSPFSESPPGGFQSGKFGSELTRHQIPAPNLYSLSNLKISPSMLDKVHSQHTFRAVSFICCILQPHCMLHWH